MRMVPLWRERRLREGWTLTEAAQRMGVTKGGLSHIERGARTANSKTLAAGCALYRCQPGDLYRYEQEEIQPE